MPVKKYFCPECTYPLHQRENKKEKRLFWGCSRYPRCLITAEDENGKPVFRTKEKAVDTRSPRQGKTCSISVFLPLKEEK